MLTGYVRDNSSREQPDSLISVHIGNIELKPGQFALQDKIYMIHGSRHIRTSGRRPMQSQLEGLGARLNSHAAVDDGLGARCVG